MTTAAAPSPRTARHGDATGGAKPSSTRSIRAASPTPNGDGIGDLPGITSRVPYLAALGIDAVWLSPFYPRRSRTAATTSPTTATSTRGSARSTTSTRCVEALHAAGIRVVVDIVPNHTSDLHEWFQEALAAGRGSAARERYIFRDGTGPDGALPPTDWESSSAAPPGSASRDGSGTCTTSPIEQPDLNWDNPRGPRRLPADPALLVRPRRRRLPHRRRPHARPRTSTEPCPTQAELDALPRRRPAHPLLGPRRRARRLRRVARGLQRLRPAAHRRRGGVGRRAPASRLREPRKTRPGVQLRPARGGLRRRPVPADRRRTTSRWPQPPARPPPGCCPTTTSSGTPPATGCPHPGRGRRRAAGEARQRSGCSPAAASRCSTSSAASAARAPRPCSCSACPGPRTSTRARSWACTRSAEIPDARRQDPTFFRSPGVDIGRDGCRVPLPWTRRGAHSASATGGAHLPQPEWFARHSVEVQEAEDGSTLSIYRRALALRSELQTGETLEWLETGRPDVLAFRRPNGWTSVTNFGTEAVNLPAGTVLVSSSPLEADSLPGATTAWLQA